jgi:hypothetical protein
VTEALSRIEEFGDNGAIARNLNDAVVRVLVFGPVWALLCGSSVPPPATPQASNNACDSAGLPAS